MSGEKKIFIAEDDQHFCELYQMALGTEGYKVMYANTGRDALEMIPREVPDLIILDVMMPEVDGYEVCRCLREMPQFALTPIIMLTALSTDDEKIKGYNVGADDYLTKPFPLKILKAKVRSLVERRTPAASGKGNIAPQSSQPVLEPQQTVNQPSPLVFEPPQPQVVPPMPAAPPPMPAVEPPQQIIVPPQPVAPPPVPTTIEATQPVTELPRSAFEALKPTVEPPVASKETPQPTVTREIIREQTTSPIQDPMDLTVKPGLALPSAAPGGDYLELPLLGPIPQGSNILLTGNLGCGKSAFSRLFVIQGLENAEKCMFICLDDDPSSVRKEITKAYPALAEFESQNQMCFVDAYSCGGKAISSERFAISGSLDLGDLSALISEAGATIGQTDQVKESGRRVIDSISSLFLNFDLPYVQRFLAFMARSGHFARISTVFVVEEGTLTEQSMNNIKYIMDGVLEFRRDKNRCLARAQALKWAAARPEWTDITRAVSG